jgi:hypothetical protein
MHRIKQSSSDILRLLSSQSYCIALLEYPSSLTPEKGGMRPIFRKPEQRLIKHNESRLKADAEDRTGDRRGAHQLWSKRLVPRPSGKASPLMRRLRSPLFHALCIQAQATSTEWTPRSRRTQLIAPHRLSFGGEKAKASYPCNRPWRPTGCETSRLPHIIDSRLTDGSEVVSLTRRPPCTSRKIPGTHFC